MTKFRTLILALILLLPPVVLGVPSPWTLQSLRVAEKTLYEALDAREKERAHQERRRKESLVQHITREFKSKEPLVRRIVEEAFKQSKKYKAKAPNSPAANPLVILAIIAQESRFNPSAVGLPGPSVGLMQVHVPSHGEKDWHNISTNIGYGTRILDDYSAKHKDLGRALASFNGGPLYAQRVCPVSPCATAYTRKVKSHLAEFSLIYHQEA